MDNSITIKTEPEDYVEPSSPQNLVEPEQVHIKPEPFQEIEEERNCSVVKKEPVDINDENSSSQVQTTIVKLEPLHIANDVSVDEDLIVTKRKKKRTTQSDNDDEEYTPKRKKKTKKDDDANQSCGSTSKKQNMMYTEDITKYIEIVTITEEDRQKEHSEMLNARKHMRHKCEWCALGYVVEDAYRMHMKVHSPDAGEYECDLCHSFLKRESMLYRHRLRHYRRYRCMLCLTLHKERDSAASHIMAQHAMTAFSCDMCGRQFKRPQYLQRHIDQHHTKTLKLECPECKRVFHERGRYRSHVRTHNEEVRNNTDHPTVTCEVCARVFRNNSTLKRHLVAHHSDVVCAVCMTRFDNNQQLTTHYNQVHNGNFFNSGEECPHCSRVLVTRAMLHRHIQRMHSDRTKKYQCDHCQRLYLTKGEVRAHIMWSHERARGGHGCARCGRVFRTPGRLRLHARRDHLRLPAPRDHACHVCRKAFENKQVLKRHLRVHSDEMYPCKECGLLFKTEPYVDVHYKLKHLNMTRAQIKGQIQKRKAQSINLFKPTIAQLKTIKSDGKLEVKINKDLIKKEINAKKSLMMNDMKDPLSISSNDLVQRKNINNLAGKMESNGITDIVTPLFETFVDIQRDVEG
ncbi:zinc finger protein 616-like [Galleria mellonella]|uniref:Zinc finger protein 616-like n=1 Tax=Galleria mellonella TaxID=7137 RepID=A0ABM3MHV7_GALME|nr:zinc finger protein 616-like [Galleria mellonella]